MNQIEVGDKVRHKDFHELNNHLTFDVIDVEGDLATCQLLDKNGDLILSRRVPSQISQ
jgi:hypothetical protein